MKGNRVDRKKFRGRRPIEIDFKTFWRTLEATYFRKPGPEDLRVIEELRSGSTEGKDNSNLEAYYRLFEPQERSKFVDYYQEKRNKIEHPRIFTLDHEQFNPNFIDTRHPRIHFQFPPLEDDVIDTHVKEQDAKTRLFGYTFYIREEDENAKVKEKEQATKKLTEKTLASEISKLEKELTKIQRQNDNFEKHIKEEMRKDDVTSSGELIKQYREKLLAHIKNTLVHLEMKQLAESIKNVPDKRQTSEVGKDKKKLHEYKLVFEENINIDPLWIDEKTLHYLNRLRDDVYVASLWDLFQQNDNSKKSDKKSSRVAAPAARTSTLRLNQRSLTPQGRVKRVYGNQAKDATQRRPKSAEPPKAAEAKAALAKSNLKKKIQEFTNLKPIVPELDKNLNISQMGFCHHCKQLKNKVVMGRCNYSSRTMGMAVPAKVTVNGITIYNVDPNNTAAMMSIPKNRNKADGTGKGKDFEMTCDRQFCELCLKSNYDELLDNVKKNKEWMCPYCQGVCYCSRCLRQDQLTKLRALYISLGGLLTELKLPDNSPLYIIVSKNFAKIKKAIVKNEYEDFVRLDKPRRGRIPNRIKFGLLKKGIDKRTAFGGQIGIRRRGAKPSRLKRVTKKFKKFQKMRLEYEKARLLATVMCRRERLKMRMLDNDCDIFESKVKELKPHLKRGPKKKIVELPVKRASKQSPPKAAKRKRTAASENSRSGSRDNKVITNPNEPSDQYEDESEEEIEEPVTKRATKKHSKEKKNMRLRKRKYNS